MAAASQPTSIPCLVLVDVFLHNRKSLSTRSSLMEREKVAKQPFCRHRLLQEQIAIVPCDLLNDF
jgi:hypothetical protein